MTFEEMNRRAARREALPHGLTGAERSAYLALCLLYELHGLGRLGRCDGVRLKEELRQELAEAQARERKYAAAEKAYRLLLRSDCWAAKALLREMESGEDGYGKNENL